MNIKFTYVYDTLDKQWEYYFDDKNNNVGLLCWIFYYLGKDIPKRIEKEVGIYPFAYDWISPYEKFKEEVALFEPYARSIVSEIIKLMQKNQKRKVK